MKPAIPRTLERTRAWLDEIEGLERSADQVDRAGLLLTFASGAVSGAVMGLAASIGLTPGINPLWAYAAMCVLTGVLVVAWRKPATAGVLKWATIAVVSAGMLGGSWSNGVMPLALYAGVIALLHLLMRPPQALALSVGLLLAMQGLSLTRHAPADPSLLLRLLIGVGVCILFWQLTTRFWRRWILRVRDLGNEMAVTVTQLEAERTQAERSARMALKTDASTGLPNRQGFADLLARRLQAPAWGEASPAGIVISIRFQAWADATTHRDVATQENLQQALVARLRAIDWPDAVLARSGRASYLGWLPTGGSTLEEALQECTRRARQLEPAITAGSASAPTQPRIGVSCFPDDGVEAAELIARADLASNEALRLGHSQPVRYSTVLVAEAEDRDRMTAEIMQALQDDSFELHYQPLVTPGQPQLHKAEALIRWNHPTRGRIPPGVFIPLAERSELIVDITDWVLREAARQVQHWRRTLHPQFQISVNMPPTYLALCAREPERMLHRLQALQAPPGSIVLEITEGVMLEVTTELLQVIGLLRAQGFMIALDDFGVGYSSFGNLDRLPLDYLKLDKTFVDDLGVRPERRPICEAIVTMAHQLGFKVVAEGVETAEQRTHLEAMGTDYLQGFLFSKPQPVADLEAWALRQAEAEGNTAQAES